jgi:hypothetical protein
MNSVADPHIRKNIFESLAPKLKCHYYHDTDDFQNSCELLALLVHQETTSVSLPKYNSLQSDFALLEWVAQKIATEAPALQHLNLGDRLPDCGVIDKVAMSCLFGQVNRMRNLQILDARAVTCSSENLAFIAFNLQLLT